MSKAYCIVGFAISDMPGCSMIVSASRVLCRSCQNKLEDAGIMELRLDERRHVDVSRNEASLIDMLSRVDDPRHRALAGV